MSNAAASVRAADKRLVVVVIVEATEPSATVAGASRCDPNVFVELATAFSPNKEEEQESGYRSGDDADAHEGAGNSTRIGEEGVPGIVRIVELRNTGRSGSSRRDRIDRGDDDDPARSRERELGRFGVSLNGRIDRPAEGNAGSVIRPLLGRRDKAPYEGPEEISASAGEEAAEARLLVELTAAAAEEDA